MFDMYKNEILQIREMFEEIATKNYRAGYDAAISKRIHPVGSEKLAELRIQFRQYKRDQDSQVAAYFHGMTSGTLIDRLTFLLDKYKRNAPGTIQAGIMHEATLLLFEQTIEVLKNLQESE